MQNAQDFDDVRALDIEHEERIAPYRQRSQVGNIEFHAVPWRSNSGKASDLPKRRFERVDEGLSDGLVAFVQVIVDGVADIVISALTPENALHGQPRDAFFRLPFAKWLRSSSK